MDAVHPRTHRLFLALWPSTAAAQDISDFVARCRPHPAAGTGSATGAIRITPQERVHVTLLFLGDQRRGPNRRIRHVARAAASHARPEPLHLRGGGRFGAAIWAGVSPAPWLEHLHRGVRVLAPPGRPFVAHLTVARSKDSSHLGADNLVRRLESYSGPPWLPDRIELIRSQLGPEPRYESLASFPLAGGTT